MNAGLSDCQFFSPPPSTTDPMTISYDQMKEESDANNVNSGEVPLCRVCERGYDGSQHFGIEVCRACAAFFRRAIEGRKKFVCRKGGDRCQLNAPRKVTCQKCRLTRCLTVGLQPELVQCKRPAHRDSFASYSPEFKVDVPSTSGEMMPFRGSVDIANDGTIFRPIPTVNPVFSTHSTCSRANLIYRVLQNYRKMYDDRWAMELEVPGGEDAPTYSAAGKGAEPMYRKAMLPSAPGLKVFSLGSLARLSTIMRKQMHYISRFIQETFDDFATFDTSEQHMILHLFMTCLWELEGSYWTYRNLPAQQIEKMMLTLTTYSDLNNLEYLIMNKDEPQDICQLKQVITSLQMHIRATLLDQMRSIILSEVEFVALLALSLWSQSELITTSKPYLNNKEPRQFEGKISRF
ncbi:hypothetical protein Y032_0057g2760 [Ancylostoma ceylanicum]|nr:hypothetical protein Y032_0057g2760 [Ancylostoma ceylanicum]